MIYDKEISSMGANLSNQRFKQVRFKALIFDIDGTAVPIETYEQNKPHAQPSQQVIDAIKKSREFVSVSAATGRSPLVAQWVLEPLGLTNLSIISGGTQIIHPQTMEILWEKHMLK